MKRIAIIGVTLALVAIFAAVTVTAVVFINKEDDSNINVSLAGDDSNINVSLAGCESLLKSVNSQP